MIYNCVCKALARLSLFCSLFVGATALADVYQYGVTRLTSFAQTANAAPVAPQYWYLFAHANAEVPGEMLDGSVSFDAPPPTIYPLLEAGTAFRQHFSGYFTSANAFYSAYPATTYTISIDRGVGPESGDVFVPEDLFSLEIPYLTGNTFDRTQALDTTLFFDGTINGFTPLPGIDFAATYFAVVDYETIPPTVVLSLNLQPADTTFHIPAGLLLPGRNYSIEVSYTTAVTMPNAGFGTATASTDYLRGTTALFTTLPANNCTADFNGDGVVDFFDYLDFVDAFAANDPSADFNGDTVIDFFDYLDFVDAFAAGC